MNYDNYLVSVIIPTYNRSHVLTAVLDSILAQTYRPIELIVVDDGSVDNTEEIVRKWIGLNSSEILKVKYLPQKNSGAPTARNHGLREASGRFIQFLDSDDLIHAEKVERQVADLKINNSAISICDFRYVYRGNNKVKTVSNAGNVRLKMAWGHSVFTAAPLIDRKNHEIIHWDENLLINQDVDFYLRNILCAKKITHVDSVLCDYIIHDEEQISDKYSTHKPQYLRRVKNLLSDSLKRSLFKTAYFYLAILKLLYLKLRVEVKFIILKVK